MKNSFLNLIPLIISFTFLVSCNNSEQGKLSESDLAVKNAGGKVAQQYSKAIKSLNAVKDYETAEDTSFVLYDVGAKIISILDGVRESKASQPVVDQFAKILKESGDGYTAARDATLERVKNDKGAYMKIAIAANKFYHDEQRARDPNYSPKNPDALKVEPIRVPKSEFQKKKPRRAPDLPEKTGS